MKTIRPLLFIAMLMACSGLSYGQSASSDSSEFCGKYFKAPVNCQTIGNMIKCDNYVFTWTYEPLADMPRHQQELLGQINNPKKINVSVMNTDQIAYMSKMDMYDCMLIFADVNGRGVIINLWVNKEINTTNDLPESVNQFITIK